MAFVCGDPKGYREAVVGSVNATAGATTALKIDTGDITVTTMMLKRIVDGLGKWIAQGGASCGHTGCNSPRSHLGLTLYDICRVGLDVHTTAYIEAGDVVDEYVERLFENPAVIEGQPPQATKQNSGCIMLLNVKSVSGMYVYIAALNCGSITRFISHSCNSNVEFMEMQNGADVKVLARMIKTIRPGTQLTVNYGDKNWFKCACDSCWVDPDDKKE
ncbi:hypothetical protein PF006_g5174 [Phytophthora fragariae]|uniref:SET domain-containing protein n=1 Tax=Phytophthora fragariae TaxID=53985 RepID=A0A6A3UJV6_9STRA|nr:hypothetical protein PF006_g5174 [Phytophthora fragariae]